MPHCSMRFAEARMTDLPFAYSLAHAECGWAWRIFDEDGETVAQGHDLSQSEAQASVESAIRMAAMEARA
jgi:hypothetical protein